MLEIRDLRGGWGQTLIVDSFSLDVAGGETVAIIGRNGVGKTTLLELLVGRAQWRGGAILLNGRDISNAPIHERAHAGLGYVPQGREVFPSLTVREHLAVALTPGPWAVERVLALFPRLSERMDSLGSQLSGGEQQMLAIGRALLGNPSVLLMDEPFEGLAPVIVEHLVNSIRRIVADSTLTLLLVEQRVDIALSLSRRCLFMDRGRRVFEGESQTMSERGDDFAEMMGLNH